MEVLDSDFEESIGNSKISVEKKTIVELVKYVNEEMF